MAIRRKTESIAAFRKRKERMKKQGVENTKKLKALKKKVTSKVKSVLGKKKDSKVTVTGRNGMYVGTGKNKKLNVTKEQLKASGGTLNQYANYMKKNDGKRPRKGYFSAASTNIRNVDVNKAKPKKNINERIKDRKRKDKEKLLKKSLKKGNKNFLDLAAGTKRSF